MSIARQGTTLTLRPWREPAQLLAEPVRAALEALGWDDVEAAPIDPELADTAAFCAAYGWPPAASANCVVVAARRGGGTRLAACVVLATTRVDVNGAVRRHLDARKASFAPQDEAVAATGMEHGGITPIGLPAGWPVLLDPAVLLAGTVVVGSGLRGSKLAVPAGRLLQLPGATVLEGLARRVG